MIEVELGLHWLFFGAAAVLGLVYLWPTIVISIIITFIIVFMIAVKLGKIQLKIDVE